MGPKKKTGPAAETLKKAIRPTSEPQPSDDFLRSLPPQAPDNWTDEQEITLFKAIIKWKPAGMHKHFRMLSIANLMKNHGVADTHTNIPGIWKKLESLYYLDAVDEQEETDDGYESPTTADFDLPDNDYYELKMDRRFATEPSPEPEDERPTTKAGSRKATAKPKKETKAETRRGKRRKIEEEKEEEEGEEENSEGDETEEEPAAPTPAKRKGRTTRAKSAGTGTAKSTPAPEDKEEDTKKKGKGRAAAKPKPQQAKRGRPTTKKKEEEPEPEPEEEEEDGTDEEGEGSEEEEEGDSEEGSGEEEEESGEESAPPSPASTKRSRSVASTRAPPKGKKAKVQKETVRRSSRKK
ncbi:hypothetical protein TWF281_010738 [Arthrobotrys megalospora]